MNWKIDFPEDGRCFETVDGVLYCGDCVEVMSGFPEGSVDLVVMDPPYGICKAAWDKWDSVNDYVVFMGRVFKEIERVLKFTGSLYFFHNNFPRLARLWLWMEGNTKFVYQNLIVWNKRFCGSKNKGFLDGFVVVDGLRRYQQMAEYILFCTFGADVNLGIDNFKSLRQYFKELQGYIGLSKRQIVDVLGQGADHCFRWGSLQWSLPTEEIYGGLVDVFKIDRWRKFKTYGELKRWFEQSRYKFNHLRSHHSVWDYELVDVKGGHLTQKPVALIKNILKHSSGEGDLVLDCFAGSGTTAVACEELNRRWVGVEVNPKYCEIAKQRVLEVVCGEGIVT